MRPITLWYLCGFTCLLCAGFTYWTIESFRDKNIPLSIWTGGMALWNLLASIGYCVRMIAQEMREDLIHQTKSRLKGVQSPPDGLDPKHETKTSI